MERYDPARLERSTRDLVSRASFSRSVGRARPTAACGSTSRTWARRSSSELPRHGRALPRLRPDLLRAPVEVAPSAHFLMGGVMIDRDDASPRRTVRRPKMPEGSTAATAWAATAWPTPSFSALALEDATYGPNPSARPIEPVSASLVRGVLRTLAAPSCTLGRPGALRAPERGVWLNRRGPQRRTPRCARGRLQALKAGPLPRTGPAGRSTIS